MRRLVKHPGDPSIGKACAACDQPFVEGDHTTLVVLGPGDDPTAQVLARAGQPYNGVAVEVHWTCAGGKP